MTLAARPLQLFGLLVAFLLASTSVAQTIVPCTRSTIVDVTGTWSDANSNVPIDAAVLSALSTAIGSVRGIRVTSEQSLVDRYTSVTVGSGRASTTSTEMSTEFESTIRSRLAGHVVSFDVLSSRGPDAYGMYAADVRVEVCLDARILFSLSAGGDVNGDMLVTSLATHVAPQAQRLGWWLVPRNVPGVNVFASDAMDLLFDTGATVVLQGAVRGTDLQATEVTRSYEVTLTYTLVDVATNQVLASNATIGAIGVGYTRAAAIQDALDTVSADLGRAVTSALVPESAVPVARFVFKPIRRAGSRFTISDRLETLPGVQSVEDARLEGDTLTIEARVNADACDVAEDLADWTRVRLIVDDCDEQLALLTVVRE